MIVEDLIGALEDCPANSEVVIQIDEDGEADVVHGLRLSHGVVDESGRAFVGAGPAMVVVIGNSERER